MRRKKAARHMALAAFGCGNGRRGGIRTRDPLHPMQVRYQAALHAEQAVKYSLKQTRSGAATRLRA